MNNLVFLNLNCYLLQLSSLTQKFQTLQDASIFSDAAAAPFFAPLPSDDFVASVLSSLLSPS
jgi:hypothetical protein